MAAPYQDLADEKVTRVLQEMRRAREKVLALLATRSTPSGGSASEYDVHVAAQLRGTLDREIQILEDAMLSRSREAAQAAAKVSVADYTRDISRFGVAPVGVDARTVAFASDVAGAKIQKVAADVRLKVRSAVTFSLAGGLTRGELFDAVSDAVAGLRTEAGVERIIRTEIATSYEQSQVAADVQVLAGGANLVKRWRALEDGRTRDDHAAIDGQERELDAFFNVGLGATFLTPPGGPGFPANAPHDPTLPPEQTIECRCFLERIPRAAAVQPYIQREPRGPVPARG